MKKGEKLSKFDYLLEIELNKINDKETVKITQKELYKNRNVF